MRARLLALPAERDALEKKHAKIEREAESVRSSDQYRYLGFLQQSTAVNREISALFNEDIEINAELQFRSDLKKR